MINPRAFTCLALVLCLLLTFDNNAWADSDNDAKAAMAAADQGKYNDAIRLSTSALDGSLSAESRWAVLGIRGNCYRAIDQYDSAIKDFNEAIRLKHPDDWVSFYNRGRVYFDKGQYDRAIEDYNESIRIKPDYSAALHNRGIAYYRMGHRDRALKDFEEAFRIDPVHQRDPSFFRDQ